MFERKISFELEQSDYVTVFGEFDSNIITLEKELNVSITIRDNHMTIKGEEADVESATKIVNQMLTKKEVTNDFLNYAIENKDEDNAEDIDNLDKEVLAMTISRKAIKPKTLGQKEYIDKIKNNTITFGVGPAGTGKTYLAMTMATNAFKNNQVSRIILTRPAIEAGESLGFLPGDLQQKVDPYLRPLYDALYELMGAEAFMANLEKGTIEVAPLAYMRGRTLDNAFIVLDEAQNTTREQMKMFLTRIGFGSKVVITGDVTQVDLPRDKKSGLEDAVQTLNGVSDIAICTLTSKDVVRHPLVQKIIRAYEKKEADNKDTFNRKMDGVRRDSQNRTIDNNNKTERYVRSEGRKNSDRIGKIDRLEREYSRTTDRKDDENSSTNRPYVRNRGRK